MIDDATLNAYARAKSNAFISLVMAFSQTIPDMGKPHPHNITLDEIRDIFKNQLFLSLQEVRAMMNTHNMTYDRLKSTNDEVVKTLVGFTKPTGVILCGENLIIPVKYFFKPKSVYNIIKSVIASYRLLYRKKKHS